MSPASSSSSGRKKRASSGDGDDNDEPLPENDEGTQQREHVNNGSGTPKGKKTKTGTDSNKNTTSQKQRANKKRSRTTSSKISRPPPPPAPPAALVQLIQSDPSVLAYFQSLQANLKADVQVWKDRAQSHEKDKKRFERQVRNLLQQREKGEQTCATIIKAKTSQKISSSSAKRKRKEPPMMAQQQASTKDAGDHAKNRTSKDAKTTPPKTAAATATTSPAAAVLVGVPIEDSMFDFDNDDDSDDNDDESTASQDGKQPPHASSSTNQQQEGAPAVNRKNNTTAAAAAACNLLELEESSSDVDDDDNDILVGSKQANDDDDRRKHETPQWFSDLDDDDDDDSDNVDDNDNGENEKEHQKQVSQLLTEAYDALQRLGVSLVDVVLDTTRTTTTQQSESQTTAEPGHAAAPTATAADTTMDLDDDAEDAKRQQPAASNAIVEEPSTRIVSPRTNEQVAADFLWALKSQSRIQMLDSSSSELMHSYPPFETERLLPACNNNYHHDDATPPREHAERHEEEERPPLHHPLKEGKLLAFRIMLILDTYCSPDVPDEEWESYFVVPEQDKETDENNKLDDMRIGLRGRKQWAQQLVESLHGEIAHAWAMQDRSVRLTTTALHFDPIADNRYHADSNEEGNIKDAHVEVNRNDESNNKNNKSILGGVKSQARLSSLLERVCLCQLVIGFYLSKNDPQAAAALIRSYLLSTAPCIFSDERGDNSSKPEDYPKLPPVQSLVLLEAMLLPDKQMLWWLKTVDSDNAPTSISDLVASLLVGDVDGSNFKNETDNREDEALQSIVATSADSPSSSTLGVSLCIHATAFIWKQRLASYDDRIHDLSRVELAAYERLLASNQAIRLGLKESTLSTPGRDVFSPFKEKDLASRLRQVLVGYFDIFSKEDNVAESTTARAQGSFGHQLCLIIQSSIPSSLPLSCFDRKDLDMVAFRRVLVSWIVALRQVYIRQLDMYRDQIGHHFATSDHGNGIVSFGFMFDKISFETVDKGSDQLRLLLAVILECSLMLANGDTAVRASWRLVDILNRNQSLLDTTQRRAMFDLFRNVGQRPLVRVINLERRQDRMRSFLCQCMAHGILVVRAVVDLNELAIRTCTAQESGNIIPEDGYYFGRHAIDGGGRMVEAHERLARAVGGSIPKLNSLVETQWRPNDLKPFDRNAPNDERLVRTSCSERACALSHVSSWKGVLRSLDLPPIDMSSAALAERHGDNDKLFVEYPDRLRRVFRISGFASGQAMHARNAGMHPVPVCVILEDDAILVDRFVDRLHELLEELPRDFHFCSLGYSRPKTAPIVPYTRNHGSNNKSPCILGIPSNLFYLTGYILSQAGAEYLLSNLPVVGPVDSWIGLKMTSNWDNVHGHVLGVGSHASLNSTATGGDASTHPALTHKDLCQILQFRAFCAMQPLCSQRVMTTTVGAAAAATSRSWRQRDTDIEYSG